MKLNPRNIAYLTLLVQWGPSNALSYAWGFLLFFFILSTRIKWLKSNGPFTASILRSSLIFAAIFVASAGINAFFGDSHFNNFFWSVVTYGSTLCSLWVLLNLPYEETDLQRVFRFSLYLTLIQLVVGYWQMLSVQSYQSLNPFSLLGPAAGDYFVGTTFDFGIGNLVAVKMSLTAMLFIPFWFARKDLGHTVLLVLLLLGWILPSAIYSLLIGFLVIVLFFTGREILKVLTTLRIRTSIFYALIAGFFLLVLFVYTQRDNVGYMVESMKQIYNTARNKDIVQAAYKVVYYRETLTSAVWKYPRMVPLGVGPGNYSSRSAWMVSGEYLTVQPGYIPVTPSAIMQKYNISLWGKRLITDDFKGGGSITNQPFSSWLSVFTEMGIIGLIFFAKIFVTLYQAFVYAQKTTTDAFTRNIALGLRMIVIYIAVIFLMDNMFEWPMVMAQFFIFAGLVIRNTENKMKEQAPPAA